MNYENFEFEVKYGNAIITSYTGEDEELIIPEKFGKYIVYQISSGTFTENSKLKKVVFPKTVNVIEKESFVSCDNLKSIFVHMMDKIENPFLDCNKRIEVVTDSPRLACKLEQFQRDDIFYISCDKTIKYSIISDTEKTCEITKMKFFKNQGIVSIPDFIDGFKVIKIAPIFLCENYKTRKRIKDIKLPKHLKVIPDYFLNDVKPVSLEIGEEIEYIGKYAFHGLNLPNTSILLRNVKEINSYAFSDSVFGRIDILSENVILKSNVFCYTRLKRLTFNTVNTLKDTMHGMFNRCECEYLDLPKNLTVATMNMFAYASISLLRGIENLRKLEENAFKCAKIKNIDSINFKELEYLGDGCFQYSNLSRAYINKNVELKSFLFRYSNLNSIEFEDEYSGDKIPRSCFANTQISTIEIPESILKIEREAFSESTIKEIDLKNVIEIELMSFYNCLLTKLTIGKNLSKFGERCFEYCKYLKEVYFDADSEIEELPDKIFCNCPIEILELPKNLNKIGVHALHGSRLKSFDFSNIIEIKSGSFYGTDLEEININIDVPDFAFSQCRNLKKVNIGRNCKVIGERAFYASGIHEISLSEGLQKIGHESFLNNVNLKFFEIPDTVTFLGRSLLWGCNLDKLIIGKGIKILEAGQLLGLSVKELILPETLEFLCQFSISGLSGLKKLIIPKSVKNICKDAINNLSDTEEVYIYGELLEIGLGNFVGCKKLSKLYSNDKKTVQKLKSRKKVEINEFLPL